MKELQERKLLPFDLVVVNLYPFERHLEEAPGDPAREEFVDIGGVTLARAAAKNHRWLTVLSDPADYGPFLEEFRTLGGSVRRATRAALAVRAFERTAAYDAAIASGLLASEAPGPFPSHLLLRREEFALRYGENPHQPAAAYRAVAPRTNGLDATGFRQIKGDRLSFTNLLDITTAVDLVGEFRLPTAAVVKHATPCGVASADDLATALERAVATDPVARYGCAIAVNRPVDAGVLDRLKGIYVDLLS
ncbi:bifunctional phosphoribosylaminoimidazolecarboxamide formyltransferase/IMP cyclohydrolase, partial [mine drainage metagenome]